MSQRYTILLRDTRGRVVDTRTGPGGAMAEPVGRGGGCGGCGAVVDVAANIVHGARRVVELVDRENRVGVEERSRRIHLCESGRCGVYRAGWCGVPLRSVSGKSCGCRVALKVWHKDESCPQGLW